MEGTSTLFAVFPAAILAGTLSASWQQMMVVQFLVFVEVGAAFSLWLAVTVVLNQAS